MRYLIKRIGLRLSAETVEDAWLMETDESSKANIRKEILQYMQTHPDAADSLNGIVNWWLSSKYSAEDMKKVEGVLEQLIKDGLVKKVVLIDKTILYKRKESLN
ncbi:hypothetical protein [Nitrosomonas sp.]|uniref:hypothetical protein n=1 Tax=Nitrosomonas sp. TaxID=42353 RepID=UPI002601AB18|nr:hypothetical protein [Nitrosomonas sp.]